METDGRRLTRRSFCTRSAALPVGLSGIASIGPLRPGPAVRWRRSAEETGGLLPSATDGERVYAFTENAVVALAAEDGSEQWRYERAHSGIPPMGIGEENVYAVSLEEKGFVALDRETGEERWRSSVPGIPLDTGESVLAADDALYAYSATDGTTDWTFDVPEGVTGMAPTPDTVFVGGTGRLHAVRREDGSERWRFEIPDAGQYRYLDPVQADAETSRVLVWDYRERLLRLFDAVDGRERWRYAADAYQNLFRGLVTERSALVADGSDVVAVNLADGTERWRFTAREELSPRIRSFENENAVMTRSEHRAYCISLDDGTADWSFDTEGEIEQVKADEDVILVTQVAEPEHWRIVRLSGRDGSLRWVADTRSERLNALTSEGRVYVGTDAGLELLTTPSGMVGKGERFLASNPASIVAGGVALAAVVAGAYRRMTGGK